ncbi:hypothetical protein EJV47_21350 [Hymenobacter gummosus]|uniref:HEAT repeat domain-containing protein n=1 Tax=Hymenobacter gummosus TaxID=1776032 RepID=A0A3S0JBE9_9BACT|nr:hypothetical protein [Hymenobacter gummosus]RTQ46503.1 hypothetical protein EJV47_21350 [Hymenobacter gummosus]
MATKRLTHRQRAQQYLREAKAAGNAALAEEFGQVLHELEQPRKKAVGLLMKRLAATPHFETKYFISRLFETVQDERVLRPLMRAIADPANAGYTANFIWACSAYDCTRHLPFFVRLLLHSTDPGEPVVACLHVLDYMQGPFEPATLKRCVAQLLRRNGPRLVTDSTLYLQDELFTTQAAHILLDKYFTQVDKAYKMRP